MTVRLPKPQQYVGVYSSEDFIAVSGANAGEPLSFATELYFEDVYQLQFNAQLNQLSILAASCGRLAIGTDTAIGTPGAVLYLDCCLTMISSTGQTIEMTILVEVDDSGDVANIFAQPSMQLEPDTDYALISIDRESVRHKFTSLP